mmetsp:Transcript_1675/g.4851  ORF Transcript_1675/g.4851 Transcript_1675/m.4851 type:complete len:243 (+) Transcript_1675:550-1278(+)
MSWRGSARTLPSHVGVAEASGESGSCSGGNRRRRTPPWRASRTAPCLAAAAATAAGHGTSLRQITSSLGYRHHSARTCTPPSWTPANRASARGRRRGWPRRSCAATATAAATTRSAASKTTPGWTTRTGSRRCSGCRCRTASRRSAPPPRRPFQSQPTAAVAPGPFQAAAPPPCLAGKRRRPLPACRAQSPAAPQPSTCPRGQTCAASTIGQCWRWLIAEQGPAPTGHPLAARRAPSCRGVP